MFPKEIYEYRPTTVLVMGTLFLLAAVLCSSVVGYRSYRALRLKEAIQLPAKILMVKRSNRSTVAEYQYQYEGQVVTSDRLTVFSETNDLYDRLRSAMSSGVSVICYLDRNDLTYSVLDRNWNIGEILVSGSFAIAFGYVGVLYLVRHFRAVHAIGSRRGG